jgi:hypothetical protein
LLQRLGVSARDTLGADVRITALTDRVRRGHGPIVVPGVRFQNE